MSTDKHVALVKDFYQQLLSGNLEDVLTHFLAPDVVWENPLPEPIPFGGTFQGSAGVHRYMGLISYLLGLGRERLSADRGLAGPFLENFAVMELRKQVAWSQTQPQLFHFRTQTGHEVDIILEDSAGRLVGIEIKAGATVGSPDFKGLRALADVVGQRFWRGLVLYTGSEALPFGPPLHALPLQVLWGFGGKAGKGS